MIIDHVPYRQTATEAHDGQYLGPPRHLHHVRHGTQSLPREVPRFKPRPSGWVSIKMATIHWGWAPIACFKPWSGLITLAMINPSVGII